MFINFIPSEHLSSLQLHYQTYGYIILPNFLEDLFARTMSQSIRKIPSSQWNLSVFPFDPIYIPNSPENQTLITTAKKAASTANGQNRFSYFFYRYDHLSLLKRLFESDEMKKMLQHLTGLPVTTYITMFATKYESNCFLSTHTDQDRGKVAFVLNLSENWKEEYGGILEFMESNFYDVKRRHIPQYNTLILFNVEGTGTPHRVTEVTSLTHNSRFALSGWYT